MTTLGRRALVAGALSSGAGLVLCEALSLAGTFDHRRERRPSARERLLASLEETASGVVHVGHSTHVVCVGGRRVLTDPWFSDPAFGALEHTIGPACTADDLAGVDAIAVSHAHPDHADLDALDRFPTKRSVSVLVGTTELAHALRSRGFVKVRVLAPWESHDLGGAVVHAVPAEHDVPEVGFDIRADVASVYFAGDTAFHGEFSAIRERLRPTFAILPVDGTRLRGSAHATMNAGEAARAARELGVRGAMPSHTEATFTDAFAKHVLTASNSGGAELFRHEMARLLPTVGCHVPAPGMRVVV
ncbi:MAG TPA: MBL fold metallo-hydrolase [Polyangiaceae bacterium]|nr:MBL fold metallo-hydrolase [Polyangiaceae bacterium]